MDKIRSPKQNSASFPGQKIQRYYAAFSTGFVEDMVKLLGLKPESIILDPWNGSGTTTAVASYLGLKSYGYDLNPAVLPLAKARLANKKHFLEAKSLFQEIFTPHRETQSSLEIALPSFSYWFCPHSINSLEALKNRLSIISSPHTRAVMETVIVHSIRAQLKGFKSKNPAWLKVARHEAETLALDFEHLELTAWHELIRLEADCQQLNKTRKSPSATLAIADAKNLPLSNNSIDAVITSPPYCTRIDYAIATLVELAWLGKSPEEIKNLRTTLIGTPTIKKNSTYSNTELPPSVQNLLLKIKKHPSKV